MFTAYVVVTLLAAAANIFSATLDFIRYKQILTNMVRVSVHSAWRSRSSSWPWPALALRLAPS